jgi:hypothetical protein
MTGCDLGESLLVAATAIRMKWLLCRDGAGGDTAGDPCPDLARHIDLTGPFRLAQALLMS